jgi:DNA-directed RNA polymerase subunit beta'
MVLGLYYLTKSKPGAKGEGRVFANIEEVLLALEVGAVETLSPIRLRYTGELIDLTTAYDDQDIIHTEPVQVERAFINTTVGRAILNDHLPEGMPYINGLLKKKGIGALVNYGYLRFGLETTVKMLDEVKDFGFKYATRAGLSIGIDDMVIPDSKKGLVRDAEKQVVSVQQQYLDGAITNGERYNKVIEIWSAITEKVADEMFGQMQRADKEGFINPIYVMADSGARGSKQQIRQLSGMRGLMAKPSGEIIESPITANFREGLTVLEYFVSTHGSGRYGAQDGRFRLPDAASGRRSAGRDHQRVRLRHGGWHLRRRHRRSGRDHRSAARPHHRPRVARKDQRLRRQRGGRHQQRDHRRACDFDPGCGH